LYTACHSRDATHHLTLTQRVMWVEVIFVKVTHIVARQFKRHGVRWIRARHTQHERVLTRCWVTVDAIVNALRSGGALRQVDHEVPRSGVSTNVARCGRTIDRWSLTRSVECDDATRRLCSLGRRIVNFEATIAGGTFGCCTDTLRRRYWYVIRVRVRHNIVFL
jgi:hypothetical protein